jgi:HAD superfamily phosphoserine phosphatase-like hydrolase
MKLDLYDFDGTIYDGDSGVDLILFSIKKKPSLIFYYIGSLWIVIKYLFKLIKKEEMKNRIFGFLKYFPDTDKFVKEFWECHEHKMKEFWTSKKSHKNDIIISASGRFWLEPIAEKYKVRELFATDIDPKTGKVSGNNCHGKEKVKIFRDKYPDARIMKMYTDSKNDLPLIEAAEEGILVKRHKLYNYYEYKPNFIVRFWRWGWGVYHKNEEVWNYLIVGGLTTVVSLTSYFICTNTFCDPLVPIELQIANVTSWIMAVLFAYVTNRLFVFKSKSKGKDKFKEFTSFIGLRLFSLGTDMACMGLMVSLLHWNDAISKVLVQVIVLSLNYIFSKLLVFKKKD